MLRRSVRVPRGGWLPLLWAVGWCLGCGGGIRELPDTFEARERDLGAFGTALHGYLQGRRPARLWLEETEVRRWLAPRLANVVLARRAGAGTVRQRGLGGASWQGTRFSGLCVQGLRRVEPGGVVPVRRPAWVFERGLLQAERRDGARLGAWVEGIFLWTPRGWRLVDLGSVEAPRWEHADLDMARCDARVTTGPDRASEAVDRP